MYTHAPHVPTMCHVCRYADMDAHLHPFTAIHLDMYTGESLFTQISVCLTLRQQQLWACQEFMFAYVLMHA
jgi:hypothetical protein